MALRYFTITKEADFQGKRDRFSNVYLYDMSATTDAALNTQIDGLLAAERLVHGNGVMFKEARCFTTFGLLGAGTEGNTYVVRTLGDVLGQVSPVASIYRECAFLLKWALPRKVLGGGALGRQRSLKKWIHACADLGASDTARGGSAVLPSIPALNTFMSTITTLSGSPMVAPDGSLPISGTGVVHPYLEHRQFPRGRKES